MAVPESSLDTHPRETGKKSNKMENNDMKKAYLMSQIASIVKRLAGSDKKTRDKTLKFLKKWLHEHDSHAFNMGEDEYMCICKGIFYNMWMSDKPLIQEECAENIASLIHLPTIDNSLLFFKYILKTLKNEWNNIDQLRLNKFLMLVRRLLRQALYELKKSDWSKKYIIKFNDVLTETVLNSENVSAIGLTMHFIEIFLEELSKVSQGVIQEHSISSVIKPFVISMALSRDSRITQHIKKHIFHHLLRQSDAGIEYAERYNAWRDMDFAGGSIDCIQKQEIPEDERMSDDDEEVEKSNDILDPRAGCVDVVLPRLKFSAKQILSLLEQNKFHPGSCSKSRKIICQLIFEYQEQARGIYPLGAKKIELPAKGKESINIKKAANELIKFENKLLGKDKIKKRRKQDDGVEEILSKRVKLNNGLIGNNLQLDGKKGNDFNNSESKKIDDQFSLKRKSNTPEKYDCKFKRNSGTWFVTNDSPTPSKSFQPKSDLVRTKDAPQSITPSTSQHVSSHKNHKRTKSNYLLNKFLFQQSELHQQPELVQPSKLLQQSKSHQQSELLPKKKLFPQSKSSHQSKLVPESKSHQQSELRHQSKSLQQSELRHQSKSLQQSEARHHSKSPQQSESPQKTKLFPQTKSSHQLKLLPESKLTHPSKLSPQSKKLFPQSEWDVPLKDGEVEYIIPAKKYKGDVPMKVQTIVSNKKHIVSNPFAKKTNNNMSNSGKKVNINLKLNKSQEISEHHAQIKSSPGIPFDANKKPVKPLLKSGNLGSPLNPFYNKTL